MGRKEEWRFGVTVSLAKQEGLKRGRWRETMRVGEGNIYKGRRLLNYKDDFDQRLKSGGGTYVGVNCFC